MRVAFQKKEERNAAAAREKRNIGFCVTVDWYSKRAPFLLKLQYVIPVIELLILVYFVCGFTFSIGCARYPLWGFIVLIPPCWC